MDSPTPVYNRKAFLDTLRFSQLSFADARNMLENSVALKHVRGVLKAQLEDKKSVGEMESECRSKAYLKETCSQELVAAKKREREMPSESTAKHSWPELVGLSGEAAIEQIEKDNGDIVAVVLRPGMLLSENHRQYRVRIFVDEKGLVTQVPMAG